MGRVDSYMHLRWHRVEDERGNRHKVCTIRHAVKSCGMDRIAFVGYEHAGRFWPVFLVTGACFAIGMQIYFLMMGIIKLDILFSPIGLIVGAFSFLGFGIPMGLMVKYTGWRSVEHVKLAVLSIGYCPSCAYRIFDLEVEDDGCSVCPECSGAWKLPESMNSV